MISARKNDERLEARGREALPEAAHLAPLPASPALCSAGLSALVGSRTAFDQLELTTSLPSEVAVHMWKWGWRERKRDHQPESRPTSSREAGLGDRQSG